MTLLRDICSPSDIRCLSTQGLETLAQEIRQKIIDVVAENGGHLASNLGTVELTLALHYIFDSPEDSLIFDVSHQTYCHKLLTGRYDRFPTLRQFRGLCGFSHPQESPHDLFYAGHAGTALSLALGMAKQRDLQGDVTHVIPILGDASLTCGLTLEALNNIPKHLKNFIVILNDNNMSISESVGAITQVLSRLVNHPSSNRIYQEIEDLLEKIPSYGKTLAKQGNKLKDSFKNLVSSAPFFEHFHLSYVGPVNGHDVGGLITLLSKLKYADRPILLHIMTEKGKGMQTAIDNPTAYHGCKPFDKITGRFLAATSCKPTFPQIFGKHLISMAETDDSLIAVTPAMLAGSCLDGFMERFPERCLDVGIAEGHAMTFCGGLASQRKNHVVLSIYATFLQRAFDNLFQDVCLQESPVVLAIDRAGISGADGSTHHGIYDISFLSAMPHLVIAQPRSGHILKELLSSAFSWNQVTAIRYPNAATEEPDLPVHRRMLGKAEMLVRGQGIAIIALGTMCTTALEVRTLLLKEGLDASIVDPIFIKPLDEEFFLELLRNHTQIVTLEEHAVSSGFGALFNSFMIRHNLYRPTLNLGIPDTFPQHGSHKEILQELHLDPVSIAHTICTKMHVLSGVL